MSPTRSGITIQVLFFLAALSFLVPVLSAADGTESAEPAAGSPPMQARPSGFELGMKRMLIGGHVGMTFPKAGSDLFDMVTRELTLEKSDFRAPAYGFDFGFTFRSRYALIVGFEYSTTSTDSESREFVEDNGQPIAQRTTFSQLPITATLRFYPRRIGETVGSYAWIPNRVLPYVAGGGGVVRYSFDQRGDFVDEQTLRIFRGVFRSTGFARTIHAAAGIDVGITTRIIATIEGRYSWGSKDLDPDFTGFEPIDLSGVRLNGGILYRF